MAAGRTTAARSNSYGYADRYPYSHTDGHPKPYSNCDPYANPNGYTWPAVDHNSAPQ
jgi:hypothetical protein